MQKRIRQFLLFLTLGSLLTYGTGCAYSPQKVNLRPVALIAPSDRGAEVVIAVKVVDERPSQSIGNRSDAYGMGAEIRSEDDVTIIVTEEIRRGLLAKGYRLADADTPAEAKLNVEVRLLEYSTSTGFFTGGIHLRSALKAEATRGSGTYEKLYRTDREERVAVVPTAATNAEWINRSLAEAIQMLFSDDALLDFLSGK